MEGVEEARGIADWMQPADHNIFGIEREMEQRRNRYFAVVDDAHIVFPLITTRTPRRADDGSAGYDFYSKETVSIEPGEMHVFWTDVKCYMRNRDEVLKVYIRSSLAYNRSLSLANAVGIIDRSYFGNEKNDGNIGIGIKNTSADVQHITQDERIAQGIFEEFRIVDNDEARIEEENGIGRTRTGGMGSTGTTTFDTLENLNWRGAIGHAIRETATFDPRNTGQAVVAAQEYTTRYIEHARQMGMVGNWRAIVGGDPAHRDDDGHLINPDDWRFGMQPGDVVRGNMITRAVDEPLNTTILTQEDFLRLETE